jgi:2-succinyl-5-enolpyruvyl-6-hydroxy-3-cyclohexene-1-carboxylate synthase
LNVDLLIHIGEVSGDTYTTGRLNPKEVWRVSPDGEVRDLFKKLVYVFEMDEQYFFTQYTTESIDEDSYLKACNKLYEEALEKLPEFGLGNLYVAKRIASRLPAGSVIHFGIYNSLRTWNMFKLDPSIQTSCNVGGFGIDGACSTLIGASLADTNKLHFLCVGDLAFFYDLNAIGNRHVGNNVRIILINNGRGVEFRKKDHPGYRFGMEADLYMAAADHYGCQSKDLVRHYATDLGFEYLATSTKEEFDEVIERCLVSSLTEKPMLLEVFPDYEDDVDNLDCLRHVMPDNRTISKKLEDTAKCLAKKVLNR